jgi:hypothetical protein
MSSTPSCITALLVYGNSFLCSLFLLLFCISFSMQKHICTKFWVLCGTGICNQGFVLTKQVLYCFNHISSPFYSAYFGDGVSWTICPSWPPTSSLLILSSWVARITGVSQQYLALEFFFRSCHFSVKSIQGLLISLWTKSKFRQSFL